MRDNVKNPFPGVYSIDEETIVRCWLILGTEAALLCDTGIGKTDIGATVRELTSLPVTVVNTHQHFDHVGGNKYFSEIYAHPADKVVSKEPLLPLLDSCVFDLGGRYLEVIHIPGHTPGSVALLDREARLLFAGDTVSTAPIFMCLEETDFDAYISSLIKLNDLSDYYDYVCCDHGEPVVPKDQVRILIKATRAYMRKELPGHPPRSRDIRGSMVFSYETAHLLAPPYKED